jgi:hypothetical protein
MGNPITDKGFSPLLDDGLKKIYFDRYKGLDDIKGKFFDVQKDPKAWIEFYSIGSVPDPVAFTGTIEYQSVAPGYTTRIEPLEYAGGIEIQRRMIDTDRYDVIEKQTKGLATAAKRFENKKAHEPFIHHDSNAFSFMTASRSITSWVAVSGTTAISPKPLLKVRSISVSDTLPAF